MTRIHQLVAVDGANVELKLEVELTAPKGIFFVRRRRMNTLPIKQNTPMIADALSLFDEQFSISDFQEAIETEEVASDSIKAAVRKAVKNATDLTGEEDGSRYIVEMEDGIKDAINSGKIKLDTNASGEIFAQLRDDKGHYGQKLPIKEELIEQGVSVEEVELALQMDIIRDQLKEIISALSSIESRVTEVLQGQHNDRLGLFYSGLSLYIEARSISDDVLRRQLTAQALKSLSDANSQMIQELRTSVEYLITEKYKKSKKITDKIDEQLSIIHQCYDIVYRASFLKAAIYHENGEIPAMLTAIDEYGRFVEKMIVPYAGKLSELDRHDQFIEKGTWGAISHTLIGCKELKQRITQNHTYYLTLEEANNGER